MSRLSIDQTLSAEVPKVIGRMAKVLAEFVAEFSSDAECRMWLRRAGYSDWEIARFLDTALDIARRMRVAEIERRYAALWSCAHDRTG